MTAACLCLGLGKDSVGFPFTWRLLNEETLTVDNPLHPPNAKSNDEADGVPGAAGPVGHRGGHHGGQGQHDDGAIKHLRRGGDPYGGTSLAEGVGANAGFSDKIESVSWRKI